MTIYEFFETLNDNFEMVFTLFDCNSEELVFMATEDAENTCEFSRYDLMCSEYSDYEIGGMDIWVDGDKIHVEFNIEIDEEPTDDDLVERYYDEYAPSSTNGDYSPSNPWDAPGMSMSDFI